MDIQAPLPDTARTIRKHWADRLLELARAAWRARDYNRAFELISRCAELDPVRGQIWADALRAITKAVPPGTAPRAGRVVRSGLWGQVIECGCGRKFGRPNGQQGVSCLTCQSRTRLMVTGIDQDDVALARLRQHNARVISQSP